MQSQCQWVNIQQIPFTASINNEITSLQTIKVSDTHTKTPTPKHTTKMIKQWKSNFLTKIYSLKNIISFNKEYILKAYTYSSSDVSPSL